LAVSQDGSGIVRASLRWACALLALPCWAGAQTAPPASVRAAYVPVTTWLTAWVAADRGYFRAHGLEVSLTPVQNISLLPVTLGRQFDIAGSTPPDLIQSAASGMDVVAVAGSVLERADQNQTGLVVRRDGPVHSLQDLRGQVIATPALGAILHLATLYWLKTAGVDPASIRAVEVPFAAMGDQLRAGRVAAIEASQPFLDPLLAEGQRSLGSISLAVARPARTTVWIAQGAWAAAHPGLLRQWRLALTDAAAFIDSHPPEARAIAARYTHLPPAVLEHLPLPHFEAQVAPAELQPWIGALRTLGQLRGEVDAARLISHE
jgi:ABC-type nitrate/sulfonate/bicarbonate transport system substrate-binding protein